MRQKEVFERLASLADGIKAEAAAAAKSMDFSDEYVREAAIDELRDRGLYVCETLEDLSDERRAKLLATGNLDDLLIAVKNCDDYTFSGAIAAFDASDDDVRNLCEEREIELPGEDDLRRHPVTEIAARLAFAQNPFEIYGLLGELREAFKVAGVSCAQTFHMVVL